MSSWHGHKHRDFTLLNYINSLKHFSYTYSVELPPSGCLSCNKNVTGKEPFPFTNHAGDWRRNHMTRISKFQLPVLSHRHIHIDQGCMKFIHKQWLLATFENVNCMVYEYINILFKTISTWILGTVHFQQSTPLRSPSISFKIKICFQHQSPSHGNAQWKQFYHFFVGCQDRLNVYICLKLPFYFSLYLSALPVAQIIQHWMIWWLMNIKLERM
jgi:hypothetical protein